MEFTSMPPGLDSSREALPVVHARSGPSRPARTTLASVVDRSTAWDTSARATVGWVTTSIAWLPGVLAAAAAWVAAVAPADGLFGWLLTWGDHRGLLIGVGATAVAATLTTALFTGGLRHFDSTWLTVLWVDLGLGVAAGLALVVAAVLFVALVVVAVVVGALIAGAIIFGLLDG